MAKEDIKTPTPEADMAAVEAAVQARIDAMLKAAQEKADAILAGAARGTGGAVISAEEAAEQARLEEYVTVQLFKDNRLYKDDVFVAINGENCLIKRGEPVSIKRKFALVLEQAQDQHNRTMALIDMETQKAARKLATFN